MTWNTALFAAAVGQIVTIITGATLIYKTIRRFERVETSSRKRKKDMRMVVGVLVAILKRLQMADINGPTIDDELRKLERYLIDSMD